MAWRICENGGRQEHSSVLMLTDDVAASFRKSPSLLFPGAEDASSSPAGVRESAGLAGSGWQLSLAALVNTCGSMLLSCVCGFLRKVQRSSYCTHGYVWPTGCLELVHYSNLVLLCFSGGYSDFQN